MDHRAACRVRPRPQDAQLIAGLIPEVTGTMSGELLQALTERRDLIEIRSAALIDTALTEQQAWTKALGAPPEDAKTAATWRRLARTVAACRDRYSITDATPRGGTGRD